MSFWKDIALGQYIYCDSSIHRLDPRIKIISFILIGIGLLFVSGILGLVSMGLLLLVTLFLSHIPIKVWLKSFVIFIWFFVLILVFHGWGSMANARHSPMTYLDGLWMGGLAAMRWVVFIGFCFLLTMTTSPSDLMRSFQFLLHPLNKIRFPVHDLSFMAGLTLHFIPLMKEEANRLMKVKMMQGVNFDSGRWSERVHHLVGLIPLLIQRIFLRTEKLAMAMEARGFSDKKGDGYHKGILFDPLQKRDLWVLILITVYLLTIWVIHRFLFMR